MSFEYEIVKNNYVGDNATSIFAYEFNIVKESHLRVIVYDSDNNETVLTLNTDYTVDGVNNKEGGNITLLASGGAWLDSGTENLSNTYQILIQLDAEINQSTDIRNNGDFYPEVHEDTFDYGRHIDLMLKNILNRAVKTKESIGTELIIPKAENGQVLAWNVTGELVNLLLGAVATSNEYSDLNNLPDIPGLAPVQSVAGKTGVVSLVKADVGLSNVDNTSDANKAASGPIRDLVDNLALRDLSDVDDSGFTQVAVVTYNPVTGNFEAGASGGGGAVDSVNGQIGVVVLDKADIGLGNVDNTSDANKPVSTAQQTALDLKANSADLATVATSGSYNDLADQPSIPNSISQLFGIYNNILASGNYTTQATDQFLTFRNCTKVTVGLPNAFRGQIIFLGGSPLIGGEDIPIELPDTTPVGTWEAREDSFGALVCEEYDSSQYRWRIVDLKSAGQAVFGTDTFTGDGSTTTFTLSVTPENKTLTEVHIDRAYQEQSSYTLSGNQITFSPAPANGQSIEIKTVSTVPQTLAGSGNITSSLFSGDGTTVDFTLPIEPVSVNDLLVFVGAEQTGNFSVSGTTLTFDAAPPSGTDNIVVKIFGTTEIGVPGDSTVGPAKLTSGVGYIEDSGVNANGEFIKYSTGEMICYHTLNINDVATFRLSDTWTFPDTFLSAPVVMGTVQDVDNSGSGIVDSRIGQLQMKSKTTTTVFVELSRIALGGATTTDFASGDNADIGLIAIGRWK